MSREVTPAVRQILDAEVARNIYDYAVITLPVLPGEVDATVLYVATAQITVDGQEYQPTLREVGRAVFNLGSPPDQTSIKLENLSRIYGSLMMEPVRRLDGAEIKIFRAFKTGATGGGYVGDQLVEGVLRDVKVKDEEVACSVLSDMSKRGSRIGTHIITQRCSKVYSNLNGIYRPNSPCGWLLSMGVNLHKYPDASLTSCDLTSDGPNGCKAHRNRHRFGAVVETLPPNFGNEGGGTIEPGGGGPPYGYCFIADTPLTLADTISEIDIQNSSTATILGCMDENGGDLRMRHAKPKADPLHHVVDGYLEMRLKDKRTEETKIIGATPGQRWYWGNSKWVTTSDLKGGDMLFRLIYGSYDFHREVILLEDPKWISGRVTVYSQQIPEYENYLVWGIPAHNRKIGEGRGIMHQIYRTIMGPD